MDEIIFTQGLSNAINKTYSYAQSEVFYSALPPYYQPYYQRYVKPATNWLDGYVPEIHGAVSGVVSTRIATRLVTGLTKQIVGERMIFRENDTESDHSDLHFAYEWAEDSNVKKAIYAGVGFALGLGTSIIKANIKENGKVWWEAVRLDQCFFTSSYSGDLEDVYFFLRNYTDTNQKDESKSHYVLCERRYYKTIGVTDNVLNDDLSVNHKVGEKIAMVEYKVFRSNSLMNQNNDESHLGNGIPWGEIPVTIRNMIRKDYSAIRVNEPQLLQFVNLGCEVLQNGNIDLGVQTGGAFGESMIVGIQDDLLTYELASSYLIRDMYLGKGTVYVPKAMSINSVLGNDSPLDNLGEQKYEKIEGLDPDKNGITVQQFQVRAQEWQTIKENSLKNIGVKWGMSPKILASFLSQGQGQMTATQIDSEDDSCIAFIYHTRSYFKNPLNKLLKTTLNFYGMECRVEMGFASPSLINKDRILNRVKGELENGLIDLEDAVRQLNPDLDEEAIQKKVESVKKQRDDMAFSNVEEMNENGDFTL